MYRLSFYNGTRNTFGGREVDTVDEILEEYSWFLYNDYKDWLYDFKEEINDEDFAIYENLDEESKEKMVEDWIDDTIDKDLDIVYMDLVECDYFEDGEYTQPYEHRGMIIEYYKDEYEEEY